MNRLIIAGALALIVTGCGGGGSGGSPTAASGHASSADAGKPPAPEIDPATGDPVGYVKPIYPEVTTTYASASHNSPVKNLAVPADAAASSVVVEMEAIGEDGTAPDSRCPLSTCAGDTTYTRHLYNVDYGGNEIGVRKLRVDNDLYMRPIEHVVDYIEWGWWLDKSDQTFGGSWYDIAPDFTVTTGGTGYAYGIEGSATYEGIARGYAQPKAALRSLSEHPTAGRSAGAFSADISLNASFSRHGNTIGGGMSNFSGAGLIRTVTFNDVTNGFTGGSIKGWTSEWANGSRVYGTGDEYMRMDLNSPVVKGGSWDASLHGRATTYTGSSGEIFHHPPPVIAGNLNNIRLAFSGSNTCVGYGCDYSGVPEYVLNGVFVTTKHTEDLQ